MKGFGIFSTTFFFCLILELLPKRTFGYELVIIHANDIHARVEPTDWNGGICKSGHSCYGGLARMLFKIKELKAKYRNVLVLFGGDLYQGTQWYTLLKWKAMLFLAQMLDFTVMSLGNHEFDDGPSGLNPFLNNLKTPVVCSNVDVSREPAINVTIPASYVTNIAGKSLGVVGYLTQATAITSMPGKNIIFSDEVNSVRSEARRLKRSGVDIVVALGHSGYYKDTEIARRVKEIDIVVGGHSHTLLSHPRIVTQANGKKVPVVQAGSLSKHLGFLKLYFNHRNRLTSWNGRSILLDSSVPQDKKALQMIDIWKKKMGGSEVIGETKIYLYSAYNQVSPLGKLVTSSEVYYWKNLDPDVNLALHNSGSIKSSIKIGKITKKDVFAVVPFGNKIYVLSIKGKYIREALEKSYNGFISGGGFLQSCGFRIHRSRQGLNIRVKTRNNSYESLRNNVIYKVAMPDYLAKGGDGYTMFKTHKVHMRKGNAQDRDVLIEYIRAKSPITK